MPLFGCILQLAFTCFNIHVVPLLQFHVPHFLFLQFDVDHLNLLTSCSLQLLTRNCGFTLPRASISRFRVCIFISDILPFKLVTCSHFSFYGLYFFYICMFASLHFTFLLFFLTLCDSSLPLFAHFQVLRFIFIFLFYYSGFAIFDSRIFI